MIWVLPQSKGVINVFFIRQQGMDLNAGFWKSSFASCVSQETPVLLPLQVSSCAGEDTAAALHVSSSRWHKLPGHACALCL